MTAAQYAMLERILNQLTEQLHHEQYLADPANGLPTANMAVWQQKQDEIQALAQITGPFRENQPEFYGCISYWGTPLEVRPTYADNPQDWERDVENEVWAYSNSRGRLDTMEVFRWNEKDLFHSRLKELEEERERGLASLDEEIF